MKLLLTVAALTCLIHFINTLALSVRLSGVRTQKLATAFSLYNVVFLFASTANSVLAPLMAVINERMLNSGVSPVANMLLPEQIRSLEVQVRLILGAATVGTIVGAIAMPVFVVFFIKAIGVFEETGSVPRLIGKMVFSPRRVFGRSYPAPLPDAAVLDAKPQLPIPKTFLVLNAVVAGLYTTGVLSAVFAGALLPDVRYTAMTLAPLINGVATVLTSAVVDPTAASITDQALNGERSEKDVKRMISYLAISRASGTVFAQVIFLPAAYLIKSVAVMLHG